MDDAFREHLHNHHDFNDSEIWGIKDPQAVHDQEHDEGKGFDLDEYHNEDFNPELDRDDRGLLPQHEGHDPKAVLRLQHDGYEKPQHVTDRWNQHLKDPTQEGDFYS